VPRGLHYYTSIPRWSENAGANRYRPARREERGFSGTGTGSACGSSSHGYSAFFRHPSVRSTASPCSDSAATIPLLNWFSCFTAATLSVILGDNALVLLLV